MTSAQNPVRAAPQKVSEVKRWLAAPPDPDPEVLAPHSGQKAAARAAAIRALGAIGSPQALRVLGQYAQDSYPDAVLKELHTAWGRFDRREFAAAMFQQGPYTRDLGLAPSLAGIDAVDGLTSLDVVLSGSADLAPLARCTALRTLRVGTDGAPGIRDLAPLLALPDLTELKLSGLAPDADAGLLANLGVSRLDLALGNRDASFLCRMPRLESLKLSSGEAEGERLGELADLVIDLVGAGVRVAVYTFERTWVPELARRAEQAEGIATVAVNGYLGLTSREAELESVGRRLWLNGMP